MEFSQTDASRSLRIVHEQTEAIVDDAARTSTIQKIGRVILHPFESLSAAIGIVGLGMGMENMPVENHGYQRANNS